MSVTADDTSFATYASYDDITGSLDFDFAQYSPTQLDNIVKITITASNQHGATISQVVELNTHICNAVSNYAGDYTCSIAMNKETGICSFPADDNVHYTCADEYFLVDFDRDGVYEQISAIPWATLEANAYDPAKNHELHYDFSSYDLAAKQGLVGLYDA